nr:hypothetical protein [Corynebacterium bovis]
MSAPAAARRRVQATRGKPCDMMTARWISPSDRGTVSSQDTRAPPADCPAAVTASGSPPNAVMLRRTHRNAASTSSAPRYTGGSSGPRSSGTSSPRSGRNPSNRSR